MSRNLILYKIQSIKNFIILAVMFTALHGIGVNGQETKISGEIRWGYNKKIVDPRTGKDISLLFFENAVYNNPVSHSPYFQGTIKLKDENEKIQIAFSSLYFEEIQQEDASLFPFLKDLSDTITINTSIGYERKQPNLIYSFVPLRRNPQSGKIERLRFFSLKITKSKSVALKSAIVSSSYAAQSVLSTGDWYKFFVSKSGVYQITYTDLINLGVKDPADVRIFGNGGKTLPEVYTVNTEDDLKEIPILMVTGNDKIFNEGDYIVFYAEGPITWSYNDIQKAFAHQKHPYMGVSGSEITSRIPYYITSLVGGSKITTDTSTIANPTIQVNSFDGLAYHEKNLYNLLQSGKAWYGEAFNLQASYNFSFAFPNLIVTEPLQIESEVLGRSGVDNYFNFSQNNNYLGAVTVSPVFMSNGLSIYAQSASFKSSFSASSDNISLGITYNNGGDQGGQGWLGYIRIVAREKLTLSSSQLTFRDQKSLGAGNIAMFNLSNASENTKVWDITDLNHTMQVQGALQDNTFSFKAKTDDLHEYIAFDLKTGLLTPEFIPENKGKIPNQNLHGFNYADLIIISHPDFLTEAQRLANLHSQRDGLSSIIVTPDQIYNEFSSGKTDPAAIRNFVKMFYDKASSPDEVPKYLLLFGDGSYDNRFPFSKDDQKTNFIVTYESPNSLDPTNTFVSDDYFGLLDDGETIVNGPYSSNPYTTGILDIGIGRFPVDSLSQATAVVDKIEKYMNNKSFGDWRNSICFVGDDEDDNIHMEQADELATYVSQNYPTFNLDKIYLDSYQQVSTSTGSRYPDVNAAILNQLNKGLLVFNYTGHGGESGLSHEQIMRQNEDIMQWKNDKYPLFVTATCDFARFDKSDGITAGEDVLLNPNGGGIGLFTTNRLVYSAPNFVLNQQFYNVAFVKTADNLAYRLGDIIRKTKNRSGIDINKLNFALLGDPALGLAYPKYNIVTDSINHKTLIQADTLKAYGTVSIQGHIEDESGTPVTSYKGTIIPTLYDKSRKIETLANDGGSPFEFNLQDKVLFKGKASVNNGEFTVNFMLPRDMDYNFGFGRISYYANDSTTDATGFCDKIVTGGLSTNVALDSIGPKIKLFMNDTTFLNGGITDAYPALLARVSDDHGINPGGNSLGHDILATLDNDPKQVYILNSYFQADIDNYKQGSVSFKFPELSPGKHTVTFKIWDIFNNSSQENLDFVVLGENSPNIQRVFNYPNPFSDNTSFFFEHNQTSENIDVTVEIYSMSGNKVRELTNKLFPTGYTSGPISWDGKDGKGNKILSGIYIYRIILRSIRGITVSNAQKMVVIHQ